MLPYRRLFKYRMGRYSGSYDISPKYRLIIRYSIYRSIAIPSSIDIDRSQVSRYFDISSIEPALDSTLVSPSHWVSDSVCDRRDRSPTPVPGTCFNSKGRFNQ